MIYFFTGLVLVLAGGIVAEILPGRCKAYALSVFTGAGAALISWVSFDVIINAAPVSQVVRFSSIVGDVFVVIDSLSAFFVIIISIMSFIVTIFSIGYLRHYIEEKKSLAFHFLFISILIVSMILVTVLQNALAFLVVWELMGLSSFMLVVFESESKDTLEAGVNYLIAMHIGVVFIIAGFAYLSIESGSMNFDSFKSVLESNAAVFNLMFFLFFTGFGTKAGFVPFHTWLPKAHPAAPGHISAMMSGIMLKTGIYGILRILTLIAIPTVEVAIFLLIVSGITVVIGITYSVYERDIKKSLAYSSIENIGIIGIAMGIGTLGLATGNGVMSVLGFAGALFHVLNHSIFKMLLFFNAGYISQRTGTRNMEELGGLSKLFPKSALLFLIGSVAICGLPPLNGFAGEAVIYFSTIEGIQSNSVLPFVASVSSMAILALVGSIAVIAFTKTYGIVFSGNVRSPFNVGKNRESVTVIFAMSVLAVLTASIGLFPLPVFSVIMGVVSIFAAVPYEKISGYENSLFYFSISAGVLLLACVVFYLMRSLLLKRPSISVVKYKTWDCGYQGTSPKIQYTSSSYSGVFVKMLKPVIDIRYIETLPEKAFPEKSNFKSVSVDRFEEYIIKPVVKGIIAFFDVFSVIQSKNVKQYLIYVMIYIVVAISVIIGLNK